MNYSDNSSQPQAHNTAADDKQPADADRRAALRRLGPLAILTPPAVMSMLVSKRASACSLNPNAPPGDPCP